MKLNLARELRRRIDDEQRKIEMLRQSAVTVSSFDDLPRAKSFASKTEKIAAQIVDSENRLNELAAEFSDAVAELLKRIFDDVHGAAEQSVLIERYVNCRTFAEIALILGYSEGTVYLLHRRGKCEFEKEQSS